MHNLRADARVGVIRDRRREARTARELHGPERAEVWDWMLAEIPAIADYESRAGRPIPVIALER